MKIAFLLSSLGGSPLQAGLDRGLCALGHTVEPYRANVGYDLVLVFQQVAHQPQYVYPDFPTERNLHFAFIDAAEFGYFRRLPAVVRDYATSFTPAAMTHDTKNYCEQSRLKTWLEGRSFPYFLREFHRAIQYPPPYHPIDYPLYAHSACGMRPSRHHYMQRADDLWLSWGASHPWRWPITHALRAHPSTRKTVLVLEENGTSRMLQSEYFAHMENAKCSVSFDGYGSGSFRMCEVLCRTVLLQGPLSIVTREPLVDGETCVAYDVVNDGEQFVSTNIGEKLTQLLADPEGAYRVYEAGYEHVNSKLTEVATARYVIDVCAAHRWDVPTPLEDW